MAAKAGIMADLRVKGIRQYYYKADFLLRRKYVFRKIKPSGAWPKWPGQTETEQNVCA